VEVSRSKGGRHGQATIDLVGIDIFTGKKYEATLSSTENVEVPNVSHQFYKVRNLLYMFYYTNP